MVDLYLEALIPEARKENFGYVQKGLGPSYAAPEGDGQMHFVNLRVSRCKVFIFINSVRHSIGCWETRCPHSPLPRQYEFWCFLDWSYSLLKKNKN